MSEPIKLNSGAVTALGDTDRVVGCDSTGALRSISFANLLAAVRDSIKVGGRNLIPDSAKFAGWTAKQNGYVPDGKDGILSIRKSTGAFYGAYRAMNFDEGQTYTLSVYTDYPNRLDMFIKYPNDNFGVQTADLAVTTRSVRKVSGIWYQKSITCKCTKSGKAIIMIESANIAKSETVRYCAPKLEQGNIPTDWSPAPEDLLGGNS